MPKTDFQGAGLLDGLHGDEREARLRLLERLADEGFSLEEIRDAAREDRLALLPVERVLGGGYTLAEAAERAGLPTELVVRIRRLQGLPEPAPNERLFGDEDVEAMKATKQFLDSGFGEQAIAQITLVLG